MDGVHARETRSHSEETSRQRQRCDSYSRKSFSRIERRIELIRRYSSRQARSFERYFPDLNPALREMYRVLKPGRGLVMVVALCFSNGYRVDVRLHLRRPLEGSGFKVCGGLPVVLWQRRLRPAFFPGRRWPGEKSVGTRGCYRLSSNGTGQSTIERRMLREYIVGAIKPTTSKTRQ